MSRAVVTGASRGIGAVVVDRLRQDGFDVVGLDVVAGEDTLVCNVRDPAAVAAAAAEIGAVEVLVNNAAIWRFAALEDVRPEDFDAVLSVNVSGAFHCIQAFGAGMRAAGRGSIVNMVSVAAEHANPGVGAYSPSKAALLALTRLVAVEWGPSGVRCNAVGPGLVPTEGAGLYGDQEVRTARARAVPLRRLADPRDVADTVSFFASDRSAYVSGQVVYVDGGLGHTLMATLPRPGHVAQPRVGP